MAPGPTNLGDNRFAPLLSPPRKKRAAFDSNFDFPSLAPTTSTSSTENPRYIVISCAEPGKKLSSYSCFGVYNAIQAIDKGIVSISTLRDGNLLLLVKSQNVADKFIKRTDLPGVCKTNAKLHSSLNQVKGTIYAPYLNDVSEEEIVNELKSQKVVAAHKFTKICDGTSKPTGAVLLTFELFHLPKKIQVAWNNALIKEYIPNPMRCRTCQRLGHTAKHCSNPAACVSCSQPPHLPERSCTQLLCVNCQGGHEASARDCPKYLEQKEILKIKTNNKCSFNEAKKIFKSQTINNPVTTSYASVAATNSRNSTLNTITKKSNTKNSTDIATKNTNHANTNNSTRTNNNGTTKTTQQTVQKPSLPITTTTLESTDIEMTPKTIESNNNKVTNNNYTYFTIPSKPQTTSQNKSKIYTTNNPKSNDTTQTIDLEMTDNTQTSTNEDSHSYNLRSLAK